MIEYLGKASTSANVAILYLYCDYRDQANQTFVNLVGSLAQQLALHANVIPTAIWNIFKDTVKKKQSINAETLQTIVDTLVRGFDCVYIGVDALDECHLDVRSQLLRFLRTVAETGACAGTTIRLFVTGRPNIEAELAASMAGISTSNISIAANKEDLQIYLSQRFSQDRYPEAMDETLRAQITDKIIKWSQGM